MNQRPRNDRNEQRAARALAHEQGVSYQKALNEIRASKQELMELLDADEKARRSRRLAEGRRRRAEQSALTGLGPQAAQERAPKADPASRFRS